MREGEIIRNVGGGRDGGRDGIRDGIPGREG